MVYRVSYVEVWDILVINNNKESISINGEGFYMIDKNFSPNNLHLKHSENEIFITNALLIDLKKLNSKVYVKCIYNKILNIYNIINN